MSANWVGLAAMTLLPLVVIVGAFAGRRTRFSPCSGADTARTLHCTSAWSRWSGRSPSSRPGRAFPHPSGLITWAEAAPGAVTAVVITIGQSHKSERPVQHRVYRHGGFLIPSGCLPHDVHRARATSTRSYATRATAVLAPSAAPHASRRL
jgi:hypothetical protein